MNVSFRTKLLSDRHLKRQKLKVQNSVFFITSTSVDSVAVAVF